MVLGLGRGNSGISTITDSLEATEEDGQSLAEQGFFPSVITKEEMDGGAFQANFVPDTGRFVSLTFYELGDQERMVIGSKQRDSEEIGEVNIQLPATGNQNGTAGETPNDVRIRLGYETANGRASYPVFNKPAARLDQSDPQDRVQQAPKRWALQQDGSRNGIAKSSDRIFVNVKAEQAYEFNYAEAVLDVPVMLSEE